MITTQELNGDTCHIAYYENIFSNSFIKYAKEYCKSISTYKDGESGWGKPIPRLQKWFQIDGIDFSHKWKSNYDRWKASEYDNNLHYIQDTIEDKLKDLGYTSTFNSCLINVYRNEMDSIKPHFDSMDLFGRKPCIAILSIGDTRTIYFKRKIFNTDNIRSLKLDTQALHLNNKFNLKEGSMLIMCNDTQKYYVHEIPKDLSVNKKLRYSMTFRELI